MSDETKIFEILKNKFVNMFLQLGKLHSKQFKKYDEISLYYTYFIKYKK